MRLVQLEEMVWISGGIAAANGNPPANQFSTSEKGGPAQIVGWIIGEILNAIGEAIAGRVGSECREGQTYPPGPGCWDNTNPSGAGATNGSGSMSNNYIGSGPGGF